MPVIYARDVWHYYDGTPALQGIGIDLGRGDILGLLGENGAGKSTLLRILANLQNPTRGSVYIKGRPLKPVDMEAKTIIGFLPENPAIYERLTGREFLHFVGRLRGMDPGMVEDRIDALAEVMEFNDKMDMFTGSYSKGIRQKFALAAALLHQPEILILDEPFSGLDPYIVAKLKRYLRNYVRDKARCILVSTHITSFAEALCNRVAIIHNGRKVAEGPVKSLLLRYRAGDLEDAFLKAIKKQR